MDIQLMRYLDGELGEDEAHGFLERLEREPALKAELEEEERLLSTARSLSPPLPPPDFSDRVMRSLPDDAAFPASGAPRAATRPRPGFQPRWLPALGLAAALVLAFGIGRSMRSPMTERGPNEPSFLPTTAVGSQWVQRPEFNAVAQASNESFRVVHLLYVPETGSPERVAVAGSFNGWGRDPIPMKQTGTAWTATLILPPGSYEYMFVEDGERWVSDPRSPRTRNDGFGGSNAVLDVDA